MDDQKHPQYATDRERINSLLGFQETPSEHHLTTAAMLLNRYQGFPFAIDLIEDLEKIISKWGLTRDELNASCRTIWMSGWKPGEEGGGETGSGFDTQDANV